MEVKKFIEKAEQKHQYKYNYSKVNVVNTKSKVCITCPEHGDFYQSPYNHLSGQGCPKCGRLNNARKSTKYQFIEKAIKIHNNKYDYGKVDYINTDTKVCIICPEHGEFWQTPHSHLKGCGCKQCGDEKRIIKRSLGNDNFITKSIKIHGNKYDYSKIEYKNNYTHVCIICPEHGEFWQRPLEHLSGCRCPICANESMREKLSLTYDEFVKKSNIIHLNFYNYSKVNYVNTDTYVKIICPEHGEFRQTPHNHLNGCGCPFCKASNIEIRMRTFLRENNYRFEEQKRFEWLGLQSLDFYLPDYSIAIECQGGQHFKPVDFAGKGITHSNKQFEIIKKNDIIKYNKCCENKIKLIYYTENNFDKNNISFIYNKNIFTTLDSINNEINV